VPVKRICKKNFMILQRTKKRVSKKLNLLCISYAQE